MATQKRPLPDKDIAKAETTRSIQNIFDDDYVSRAFEGFPDPGELPNPTDGSNGQVWSTDGLSGSWIDPISLSSYENIIVVDAGGNGDYTTLRDAVGAVPLNTPTTIFVMSDTSESAGNININTNHTIAIHIATGKTVSGAFKLTAQGTSVFLTVNGGTLTHTDPAQLVVSNDPTSNLTILDCFVNGRIQSQGTVYMRNVIGYSTGSAGVLAGFDAIDGCKFQLDNCTFVQTGGALNVACRLYGTDIPFATGSYIKNSRFEGSIALSTSVTSYTLDLTSSNFLGVAVLPVGATNHSNVVDGATYPAIP